MSGVATFWLLAQPLEAFAAVLGDLVNACTHHLDSRAKPPTSKGKLLQACSGRSQGEGRGELKG